MRRALVALALLLAVAAPQVTEAADDCNACCKLETKLERTLRNLRAADAVCTDTGDPDSCEIAIQLAAKYLELHAQYAKQCEG